MSDEVGEKESWKSRLRFRGWWALLPLGIVVLGVLYWWIDPDTPEQRMSLVTGVAVALGAVFTFYGLQNTRRSLELSQETARNSFDQNQQAQLNDRYFKAVEQLGHAEEHVKIGAIYSLGMLLEESEKHRSQCREVLVRFIRVKTRLGRGELGDNNSLGPVNQNDVQTAIDVLGQWSPKVMDTHGVEGVDLSGLKLAGYQFDRGWYREWDFSESDLSESSFLQANLQGADFSNTICRGTNFFFAELGRAQFVSATLDGSHFGNETDTTNLRIGELGGRGSEKEWQQRQINTALRRRRMSLRFYPKARVTKAPHLRVSNDMVTRNRMEDTSFRGASVKACWFVACDLSRAEITDEQLTTAFWNEVTALPSHLEARRNQLELARDRYWEQMSFESDNT